MNVTIRISGGWHGDIEISLDEPTIVANLDYQRKVIDDLLTAAVRKARLAYEIEAAK